MKSGKRRTQILDIEDISKCRENNPRKLSYTKWIIVRFFSLLSCTSGIYWPISMARIDIALNFVQSGLPCTYIMLWNNRLLGRWLAVSIKGTHNPRYCHQSIPCSGSCAAILFTGRISQTKYMSLYFFPTIWRVPSSSLFMLLWSRYSGFPGLRASLFPT